MYLGIDVSKATLDVALLVEPQIRKPRHRVFSNTSDGHQQLLEWSQGQDVGLVLACIEATGTYAEPVDLILHEAGHPVSLVNPSLDLEGLIIPSLARRKQASPAIEPLPRILCADI